MDEPCESHVTFLVCLLLFFHRERSQAPRGRVEAGGPGALSPTSFENLGAVLSQLVRECPRPRWQFLVQPLTLCSCCFADLVHISPPPPIVLSRPVKWCHGQLKSIQEVFKAEWLQYTLFRGLLLLAVYGNHTLQAWGGSPRIRTPLLSSILSPAHVASGSTPHLHPRALDQGQHG